MKIKKIYQRQKHINAVLKNSGARYSAQAILMAMCIRSHFDQPTVTITKADICFLVGGLHRRYIMLGLRELEETGVIEVIRNGQGGHSIAPTYHLIARPATEVPESSADIEPEKQRVTKEQTAIILRNYGFR